MSEADAKIARICVDLDLPEAQIPLRGAAGGSGDQQIYDRLRGKWVALTPEEWVRQNFVSCLISRFGYPAGMMANEVGIVFNGMRRRCDTVVYGNDRTPVMIVEYKAPDIVVDRKVFDQIMRYNMVLKTPYLVVTNGHAIYCCHMDYERGGYEFMTSLPEWAALLRR